MGFSKGFMSQKTLLCMQRILDLDVFGVRMPYMVLSEA